MGGESQTRRRLLRTSGVSGLMALSGCLLLNKDGDNRSVTNSRESKRNTSTTDTDRTVPSTQTPLGNWPMSRYDLANTGYASEETGPTTEVDDLWSFDATEPITGSPAVVDGIAYVTARQNLYALDSASGERLWSIEKSQEFNSSPLVANGDLYIGNSNSDLYRLGKETGEIKGRFETSPISMTVASDELYVGTTDGSFLAIDPKIAAQQWTRKFDGTISTRPAFADGIIYFCVSNESSIIYAITADTGEHVWSFDLEGYGSTSPPVVSENRLYFGASDNHVHAIDATSGKEVWSFRAKSWVTNPLAVANGTVYVNSHDGILYALDATTGSMQWAVKQDARGVSGPVVADDTVYFCSLPSRIYAVSADNGKVKWTYSPSDLVSSELAIVDETVFVGSRDGHLSALVPR